MVSINKHENFQLNYTDYISLFTNIYFFLEMCLLLVISSYATHIAPHRCTKIQDVIIYDLLFSKNALPKYARLSTVVSLRIFLCFEILRCICFYKTSAFLLLSLAKTTTSYHVLVVAYKLGVRCHQFSHPMTTSCAVT